MSQLPFTPGLHLLIDHFGGRGLTDPQMLRDALTGAAHAAGATILSCELHGFEGGGITGVVLLAESHITIHTWPERDYAAIDIFMCGNADPHRAAAHLEQALTPARTTITAHQRGH